jgi:hypothetical protein
MRGIWVLLTALVLAVIGGIAVIWFFDIAIFGVTKGKLEEVVEGGKHAAQGYKAAKTPSEAMNKFKDAIKERNYSAASRYCSGEYSEKLKKAHDAANAVGSEIDRVINLGTEKGILSDKAKTVLTMLDPFPKSLTVKDVGKADGKKCMGLFLIDLAPVAPGLPPGMQTADVQMFQCVLLPPVIYKGAVPLVATTEGEETVWKIDFPLPPNQRMAIDHFITNHKSYVTALDYIVVQARSGRFASKADFEREVLDHLVKAK